MSEIFLPAPSHALSEESMEAKVRWFRRFSEEERWALFLEWMTFLLSLNPNLLEQKKRQPPPAGFRAQIVVLPEEDKSEPLRLPMLQRLPHVFRALNRHQVRYLVIGGVAAVLYGVSRTTFDLDLWIEPTLENARRLLRALEEAGFGTATLTTPEAVLEHEITVFQDWIRIDVFTHVPGLHFPSAWENRHSARIQDVAIWVLSREDLITAKKATGRPQDLEDARVLENLPDDDEAGRPS